ncbi:SDR family oxidoreductase [Streptosporangium sp. G12]
MPGVPAPARAPRAAKGSGSRRTGTRPRGRPGTSRPSWRCRPTTPGTRCRQLAAELGPYGIRVVTLRTGGLPETIPADLDQREVIERDIVGQTLTGRAASLEDVGNAAVFAASDLARAVTSAAINITCGAVPD